MRIIKECVGHDCILREDNYDTSLAKITRLFNEARRDFPQLREAQVRIVFYGGDRYSRTLGIEFTAPVSQGPIPDSYRRRHRHEVSL